MCVEEIISPFSYTHLPEALKDEFSFYNSVGIGGVGMVWEVVEAGLETGR